MIFDTSNQNEKIIESIKFIKTDEKQTSYQELNLLSNLLANLS
jgi:hypothetical protein